MRALNVLVACEESQTVCTEFRKLGHNAYSCDLQECSGGHPEWHIKGDVLELIDGKCQFDTQDGEHHFFFAKWDLIIAHPPCTFLTITGNRWLNVECYGDKAIKRLSDREDAVAFFLRFVVADCKHIAIENPIGCMSTRYRKPNQIVQPYQFGDPHRKATCLWLFDLPNLYHTDVVEIDTNDIYTYVAKNGRIKTDSRYRSQCKVSERAKHRSKTFQGIAKAMAQQWSAYILNQEEQ